MYKKAVASFWSVEEVDLSQDARDWERLTGPTSVALCGQYPTEALDYLTSGCLTVAICSCR